MGGAAETGGGEREGDGGLVTQMEEEVCIGSAVQAPATVLCTHATTGIHWLPADLSPVLYPA